ncbi:MAG: orotidine-5'-phosphate decarboxylase [Nitrospirae bacterium]|nr:orotidine-5'-phosphate decarboxylase [Nitrospirota bacterium]MCL5421403.1 orotidine-5'-phosphate decarboxylase [Nitrospirota bacterium]
MYPKEHLILTLDDLDYESAIESVERFYNHVDIFRVGIDLFISAGPKIVGSINEKGKKVFLDLKFNDIPTSVTKAIMNAAKIGAYLISIHTSVGLVNMKSCVDNVKERCLKENIQKPKIVGVTVLTSMSQTTLKEELGVRRSIPSQVTQLAQLGEKAGIDGVVVPAHEVFNVRKHCGKNFLIAALIRPSWVPPDDKQTAITPKQAIKAGADYLILGRTFLRKDNPVDLIELISVEILSC